MTSGAEGTLFKPAGRIGAEPGDRAAETVGTVVKGASKAAGLFENKMVADFFGDGSTVTA